VARLAQLYGLAALTVGLLAPAMVQAQSADVPRQPKAGRCIPMVLRVSLAPGGPARQTISGTLCATSTPNPTHAIDVLVHGATYDRSYWDSPFDDPRYSYVARTLEAGRATFFYDRLGVGKSSRLPSTSVTMPADAYVLHQILQHFHRQFRITNVIGHSYGSRIAQLETSEYNDATRLVLSDNLHAVGPALTKGEIVFHPAIRDPRFAGQNLDTGWTTTTPAAGRAPFYYLPGADSNEIAYDDAHKSIVSTTQFQQGIEIGRAAAGSNVSNSITRPVLVIAGEADRLACGLALDCTNTAAVNANEQPFYTSAASLTVITIPDTGHDLALHRSAGASFDAINHWLQQ
jgi:pimeloyl-ACP methyl ester carboxylesterase